jgi:hypothetical protein
MRPSAHPQLWAAGGVLAACLIVAGIALASFGSSGSARLPRQVQSHSVAAAQASSATATASPASEAGSGSHAPGGAGAGHVRVCGNAATLGGGPRSAPSGAVTVAAGDNSRVDFGRRGATYWLAPGVHTLGSGRFDQIVPGAGAKFVGAPGAILDGQRANYYAFVGGAPEVTISYLTVQNFGTRGGNMNEGVVNHDSAAGWTIDHSTIKDNAGAGVMLGSDDTLSYDCLANNQQYGFSAYSLAGPANVVLSHNEIAGNDTYNWEAHQSGCGCTGGGKFWDVNGAVVTDNWIHDNHSVGLWADTNNRGFDIEGNYIDRNYDWGLIYEISYNALIKDNTFVRNGLGAGPKNTGFPTGAIYLSESGSDSRIPGKYGRRFEVTANVFRNNWGGVVLWENANRFCGSPANTSTGDCTLVSPHTVTVNACRASGIARQPYLGACRWKTQNVSVDHNVFDFSPAAIGPSCSETRQCGFQGVFSEYGNYPSWSPYQGRTVENAITFHQSNHFAANTYSGPWLFMARELGNVVTWSDWQGGPYHQDAGSTLANPDS